MVCLIRKTVAKRPLEDKEPEEDDQDASSKKAKTTESILDDITISALESRIEVHIIESPEACTHEVAVYPGS